jgi:hypothetical protein
METSSFNDIGAIFLNGEEATDNIALLADGKPVSVNTIVKGGPLCKSK